MAENESNSRNIWTILVSVLLGLVLLLYLFSFQVQAGYVGLVYTFGRFSSAQTEPGFNFKLPYPIQTVRELDVRTRIFDTKSVECLTKDKKNLNITVSTGWRITDPALFVSQLKNTAEAESALSMRVNSARNKALAEYALNDLVNTDFQNQQKNFANFEERMLDFLRKDLASSDWGLSVEFVALKQMEFPKEVADQVFERMKKERQEESARYREEGKREAEKIRSSARAEATKIIARAEAESERIRGEGDAAAAKHYGVFRENPELANYLREIKTLRKVLANKKSTVILSTRTAPFSQLEAGSNLESR